MVGGFNTTIRYVCCGCGWRWTREVRTTVAVNTDLPFATTCPTCAEENG